MIPEIELRKQHNETPAGKLLLEMGREFWDTESSARRVAEYAAERIARLNTLLGDMYKREDSIHASRESWKERAIKAEAMLEALTSDEVVERALRAHHGSYRKQENDGEEYIDLLVAMRVAIATARAEAYRCTL